MATVNFIRCKNQGRASLRGTLDYVRQDKKCLADGVKFITGKDCCAETAYTEFMTTKNSFEKAKGVFFYHYTQSFSPEEKIMPAQAHQVALKLAEHYEGFEVLVATHCDREHIHSHLVINSVSFADGKKLRQDPHTLERLRRFSDEICREMGLTTLQPYEQKPQAKAVSTREYRAAEKGESWKFRLMSTIDTGMQSAQTPADFIALMKRRGYGVRWEVGRKSITYTTPEGKKCRDNKLHEAKYLKERMELEFGFRATQAQEQREHAGAGATLPTDHLRDSESTVGINVMPDTGQPTAAPVDMGMRGRTGDSGNPAPLPSSDEAGLGGNGEGTAQPSAGVFLTGWEDERSKHQMGQRFGWPDGELAGAIPEESMEEDDLDFHGTEYLYGPADDPAANDYEVDEQEYSWHQSL